MCKHFLKLCFAIGAVVCFASCVDTRKTTYFNETTDVNVNARLEDTLSPLIQKNDILSVLITSANVEASAVFNLSTNPMLGTGTSFASAQFAPGYLVNTDGFIQIPTLGQVRVLGLTTKAVREDITRSLVEKKLLFDPVVSVRHLNYEVTIIGEVGRPTVISVPSERISLLKALGMAGDMTIYGKKDNVLLIREVNGKRQVRRLNLNSPDFLTSPYYYLQPNDVVYVEANKDKISTSSSLKQTLPIVLSGISIVLIALDRIVN